MGQALFKQMYDDALAVDRRAMTLFLDLLMPSSADQRRSEEHTSELQSR